MPEHDAHNYIPDSEPAPYGSSFTEEQEERQAEEEGITLEENVNFETNSNNQMDLSEEVIRKKGLETLSFAINHKKNNAHLTGS